ncbi:DUF6065 family protein [Bordetella avium]|uniref:DUF6065 family protein n=1 Tax=Bordetella avium TaxID=521 RepID=UPI000E0BB86D|nr:DUF6065 family protein [Bordetella avium]AZY49494.1 hypothetical protein C0J09_10320 [Bordetella avium]AZY52891.1 hypothetical protein C0J07_10545 [Bordetella avium]RIQ11729.1 hypothetical protein D0432_15855 [Bordetella avium]RIQ16152.1 hypothetical protein D0850_16105 [Bordetella avium]RIQ30305.1 hypothetical protein D0849_15825 [Bordetella avium]
MKLIAYRQAGWKPRVRPAPSRRAWMDETNGHAYRCLPLTIANAHGWEFLNNRGFEVRWNGDTGKDALEIVSDNGEPLHDVASVFGHGILTFHVSAIMRTEPGWNLWVGGSPNRFKDGIAPLTGIVETDWSPYTFTMNWRFTRPGQWVRFDENEPICFVFPVLRDTISQAQPVMKLIEEEEGLLERHSAWAATRQAVNNGTVERTAQTSLHYLRGTDMEGKAHIPDHRQKVRAAEFTGETVAIPEVQSCSRSRLFRQRAARRDLDRLFKAEDEWLLGAQERLRGLAHEACGFARCKQISAQRFLAEFYAPGRPALFEGLASNWPALSAWTRESLLERLGDKRVEVLHFNESAPHYDLPREGVEALKVFLGRKPHDPVSRGLARLPSWDDPDVDSLREDIAPLDALLARDDHAPHGQLSLGADQSLLPMHRLPCNRVFVQIKGRRHLVVGAPGRSGEFQRLGKGWAHIPDITKPDLQDGPDVQRFYHLTMEPGDVVFIPVGWWLQARAEGFCAAFSFEQFLWPNEAYGNEAVRPELKEPA